MCAAASEVVPAAEHLCQCAKCSCNFDHSKVPEKSAGVVECPNCKAALTQDGKAVEDQAAKEKANDGKEIVAATDAGAESGLDASNPKGINQYSAGQAVKFHTPQDDFEKTHSMHVVEDRGDRLLVQHNQGFETSRIKPQSVVLKSDVKKVDAKNATRQPALEASNPEGINQYSDAERMDSLTKASDADEKAKSASMFAKQTTSPEAKVNAHMDAHKAWMKSADAHYHAIKVGNTDQGHGQAAYTAHQNAGVHLEKAREEYPAYIHEKYGYYGEKVPGKVSASNATNPPALQAGFNGNQHKSAKELAAEHSVAADTASKVAASASKAARNQDPSNKEGLHDQAMTMHTAAKSLHELAAAKHRSAGNEDCAADHDTAAAGHGNEMQAHKGVIEACGGQAAKTAPAATAAALASDATPAAGLQLDCSACVEAKNFKNVLNPIADGIIQYMPAGTHTITPSQNGRPVTVSVEVDAAAADKLEQQRRSLEASGKKPFFSVQHSTQIAAFWPAEFFWDTRLDATGSLVEGVWARGEWTRAGREAVEGKDFRTFSPTFFVDAIRNDPNRPVQVVCNDEAKANMGALENDPAFQTISPLWCHDSSDGQPKQKPAGVTTEKLIVMVHDELRASNPDLQDVVNALSFKYDMRVRASDVARALRGEALEAGGPGSGPRPGGGSAKEDSEKADKASEHAQSKGWKSIDQEHDWKGTEEAHRTAQSAHESAAESNYKAGNGGAGFLHDQKASFHKGLATKANENAVATAKK